MRGLSLDFDPPVHRGRPFIHGFGLQWQASQVDWKRGRQLLGTTGRLGRGGQIANFWEQSGVYILFRDERPRYVGFSKRLGHRLGQHRMDDKARAWATFSWFGFKQVLKTQPGQIAELADLSARRTVAQVDVMREMEALLIHTIRDLTNLHADSAHIGGQEWFQLTSADRLRALSSGLLPRDSR